MTGDAERAARQEDIATFFAMPRLRLYAAAALALVLFVGGVVAATTVGYDALGLWLPPLVTGSVAVIIAVLRQSATGRGALWCLVGNRDGGTRPPRFVNLIWVVLTVLLAAIAAYLKLATAGT